MYKNYIAGDWQDSVAHVRNINPSDTTDIIGEFAQATTEQVDAAIVQAMQAQQEWQNTGLEKRYQVLMAIGDELIARKDELGEMLCREEGKTLPEGAGEVYRSGQFFHYYAAETLRQMGEMADSVRPGVEVMVQRDPMGLVAIISPWNFPVATATWKIAPALAYGNAVIWKPANETPLSAYNLAEIIAKQDIPKGLFSLTMGKGSEVGNRLINDSRIDAISFTGSYSTGKRIAQAAASNLTKFQLELGSKNALYISEKADMDIALPSALGGAFFSCGQKCTASSRLVVHEKVHDAFVDKLTTAMQALKIGHALDASSQLGPVVSADQLQANLTYAELGKQEGAELIGGQALELPHKGHYMAPGLFVNSCNDMRINREEMFAPLASVIKVHDLDEAIATVADTEFGLTSGIISSSLSEVTRFRREAKTGCVMVNLPTAGTDYHVPFGGRKNSSFGSREQGHHAQEFYTQVKTSYVFAG